MTSAYFNGQFVKPDEPVVPISERGHQFGDGVYEVIRVYEGKPFMMEEHLDRLYKSAEAIKLKIDPDRKAFKNTMLDLIQKSESANLDVYVQVTRGIAPRNHLFPDCPVSVSMTTKPFVSIPFEEKDKGASVILHPDERWANCYIKSLNLLPNILAKQTAYEKGCLEAILVRDGKVTEGTSSNVYIVEGSSIITTPILHGITRQAVKKLAEDLGIPFIERYFTPEEMYEASEVFISSTTLEITSVGYVDDEQIGNGMRGPITRTLQERFYQVV